MTALSCKGCLWYRYRLEDLRQKLTKNSDLVSAVLQRSQLMSGPHCEPARIDCLGEFGSSPNGSGQHEITLTSNI